MTESERRRREGDTAGVPPVLGDVIVVLNEPQNVVNVAGVVRAMKNMGLSRLRVVRPAEWSPYRIEGIAHRSEDVVGATQRFDTLSDALADVTWVLGTSARARTANRNYLRPREAAEGLVGRARAGPVALVLGREDKGLSNEDLDLCHAVAIIPTAPEYSSLNLAQAFLVLAYEAFLAAEGDARPLPRGRRATRPATREELESMYGALQDGLSALDFFKGSRRPEAVMRTLRTVLGRAELDGRESRLVRAIGFEMRHFLERKGVAADAGGEGE